MFVIRCKGQTRGFRVDGAFYAYYHWRVVDAPSESERNEPMLEVREVSGPDDPALAPFPVDMPDAPGLPSLEELAGLVQSLRAQVANGAEEAAALRALVTDLEIRANAALAENVNLKAKLSAADKAGLDARITELEHRLNTDE